MRPLPEPYDAIAAGRPAAIRLRSTALLGARLLTKDLAFPPDERRAFGLEGLLPDRVQTIEDQLELELEHLRRKDDPLERYIGLAALQDRNATLFYRLLAEHTEEFLPIVYTPTVGRACQEFSHILRRTRGLWITPADRGRVADVLDHSPYEDVRLIVVTDNERILGLGDQGAGGMAIPIGKLALYTAASGIHPALTLPMSLDVGTDNPLLLADPLYVGHRAPRLRGAAYDELVEEFVVAVAARWPGCVIQWEDFKQHNALRILDRYRDRICSFNDDVQGTAAVVLGGILAAIRLTGERLVDQRVVIAGSGAAGVGIARLIQLAMVEDGASRDEAAAAVAVVDSRGLVHAGRADLDPDKRSVARSLEALARDGLAVATGERPPSLLATIRAIRPSILLGATGMPGTFDESVIEAIAERLDPGRRPIVMPLSNPTNACEAPPADILRWSDGRALVATGSPFAPVDVRGELRQIGQANNVFVFPGLGLGAIVAETRRMPDRLFLAAARTLASCVTDERLASGALYPRVDELRSVTRAIARTVVAEARVAGIAGLAPDADLDAEVDAAMWWPDYVPYVLATERRSGPT
ncbi:MAG TPA: NAD-dependent malic enzyme [Candidatus Limnocylindrales bacterium]|nr:NAD-dependent malic enzyme [Candidatus Limnocylindrales bacterium]